MSAILITALLLIGAVASWALFPTLFAYLFRGYLRQSPAIKAAFVSGGSWIAFSKRFGLPYAIAAFLAPFLWMFVAMRFVPDTTFGAWVLFGPAFTLLPLGAALGGLWVARWMVDER